MDVIVYGLVNSMTLALMAVGFSFVFGISQISNFAHGAFYVLGSFIAWGFYSVLGLPYPLVVLFTIISNGLLGAFLFWVVIYRLRGQPILEVIASFSAGIAILEFFRWVGGTGYFFNLPTFFSGSIDIGDVTIDYQRLAICAVAILSVGFLTVFIHHTKIGLACRGMAQDEETALCFGIDSDQVAMISMAIGAALVAVATITITPIGFISIDEGYQVIILSLAVCVVGGLESIFGVMVASLILGFSQTIVTTYIASNLLMIVPLLAILIVLAIKPSGLFGKFKELEERV
ncbi:branched-chain amino acid ABC transporter permease [Desulfatiglans anilini]|uniref:branched-chain amino acid ABC transporter permease n=1 Tax=Desulfatiglans anilini TaxID=90728 RepID=UPI00048250CE|nr:branched-chain amino acid ABC transporter permease [Desulfatiglans anilini]